VISVTRPRVQVSFSARTRNAPLAERLLRNVGADPRFVEDVLGDLAEEYASQLEREGLHVARMWYVREVVRSAPHLFTSGLRRASRRHRARVAACLMAGVLTALAVALSRHARSAVSLEADPDIRYVVNSARPVQLPVRVLDAAGRMLRSTGVRFRWMSGAPVTISPSGVAMCVQSGDATVRASLGALSTDLLIRCRPVRDVRGPAMLDLVVGDAARDVPFEAVGVDGRPVTLLAGEFTVRDSTVATLEGPRIRARRAGTTWVRARFGDRASFTSVHVYERVPNPEAVRQGQHVAVSVRLAAGQIRQWRLPAGHYFLTMLPDGAEEERPRLAVADSCKSVLGHIECFARHEVTVWAFVPRDAGHPGSLSGTLAVWRHEDP
jgi:hypothetical protein